MRDNNVIIVSCGATIFCFFWMMYVWWNLSNINDKLGELILLTKQNMGIPPDRKVTLKSLYRTATGRTSNTSNTDNDNSDEKPPTNKFDPELVYCSKCGSANRRGHRSCIACFHKIV